jgi:Domain of unknown function (DUF6265)
MRPFCYAAIIATSVFASACAHAQDGPSNSAVTAPASSVPISVASWMIGCWEGEGLGGRLQECWSASNGTQMAGHFTLSIGGTPQFHEFMLLEEHQGGLRLRVKHFNPDMTGWEEKDASVDFSYVSSGEGRITFSALDIQRIDPNTMVMHLRLRGAGGVVSTQELQFRRVGS